MAGSTAFQSNAFQINAFQIEGGGASLTSTRVLQMPVDCVMAGDQEEYRKRGIRFKTGRAKGRALKHAFGE